MNFDVRKRCRTCGTTLANALPIRPGDDESDHDDGAFDPIAVRKEPIKDYEMKEAINDLLIGVTQRWKHDPHGCALIVANTLGAVVANQEHNSIRDMVGMLNEYMGVAISTAFDVVDKAAKQG